MSELKKLGDFATIGSGYAFSSDAFSEDGIPIIRMSDLCNGFVDIKHAARVSQTKGLDGFKLNQGDFLIGMSGSLDAYGVVGADVTIAYLNQRVGRLSIKDPKKAHYGFFAKVLSSDAYRKYVYREGIGAAQLNISSKQIECFEMYVPEYDIQEKIFQILDTIDTAIQQTQAIINKLKQLKQGLLHDLLTRGVDAKGELRPCYDDAPHLYKESPLGWIPKEWECVATRDLCSIITKGTTPSAGDMWQGFGGVPFLRVDNLYFDGSINFQASNFRISVNTHSGLLSRSMCIFNDVLMNIVGPPLGKLGLIDESLGSANINQAIAMFRPTNDVISQYLLIWLSGMIAKEWLRCRAKQTSGQVNLTLELCQQLPIPKISISEQQRIVDQLQAMKQKINYEASYLNKLEQNKTALMDDLLTGRIRVTSLLQPEASSA